MQTLHRKGFRPPVGNQTQDLLAVMPPTATLWTQTIDTSYNLDYIAMPVTRSKANCRYLWHLSDIIQPALYLWI